MIFSQKILFQSFFEHIFEHINRPLSGLIFITDKCRSEDQQGVLLVSAGPSSWLEELMKWVANPLGLKQTRALKIKTRTAQSYSINFKHRLIAFNLVKIKIKAIEIGGHCSRVVQSSKSFGVDSPGFKSWREQKFFLLSFEMVN